MYLKRMELVGFKSFAKPTVIHFKKTINGIIGPNGSGKSNISDAIRWVFGETSQKTLRVSDKDDFIFKGNENEPPMNMAEIKLIFDNKDRKISYDRDEVEISKRSYRGVGENEYFINRTQVRLKDVQEIVLDSGLSKNSLALISQGNLNDFITSTPDKKRLFFEEAAGVAKFRQKKIESERKLARTQDNLDRVQDIIDEISKQLNYLERQATKAQKYLDIKKELEEIETKFIVAELNYLIAKHTNIQGTLKEKSIIADNNETQLENIELKIDELKNKINDIDRAISSFQVETSTILGELEEIQKRSGEKKLPQDENRIKEIFKNREANEARIKIISEKLDEFRKDINDQENGLEQLEQKKLNLFREKFNLENQMIHLRDGKSRLPKSVEYILSHKESFDGLYDVVFKIFIAQDNYEIPISVILKPSNFFVVTKDNASTKAIINFLKANNAGRATFLPINDINYRNLDENMVYAIKEQSGFLGFATDFVLCDRKFIPIKNYLFSKILIVDNLDNANAIASLFKYSLNIVTLDGTFIRAGGSITGGSHQDHLSNQNLSQSQLQEKIDTKTLEINTIQKNINTLKSNVSYAQSENNHLLVEERVLARKIQEQNLVLSHAKNQKDQHFSSEDVKKLYFQKEQLKAKLETLHSQKLDLTRKVIDQESFYKKLSLENKQYQNDISNLRLENYAIEQEINKYISRLVSEYKITYEFAKKKWGDLKRSADSEEVREKIKSFQSQITNLMPVDIDSIEKYKSEKSRYDYLFQEHTDLQAAKNEITKTIDHFNKVITEKFNEIIQTSNKILPSVVQSILGVGSAQLVLDNPDDLLESGVYLNVHLPGKKINNLNLLSGGEKTIIALSVLFTILKINPLPLIFLDEAEAPLDISNVKRLINFLRTFRNITQFIIITHRPGTMESCDTLYGVTMQVKGITKIVSISLEEIKSQLPSPK